MEKKDLEESIERLAAICRVSFSYCQYAINAATASYRRESELQKVQKHFQSARDGLCRGVRVSHTFYDDFILPDNTIEAFSRGKQPEDVRAANLFRSSVPARQRNRKSKAKKSPKRFF